MAVGMVPPVGVHGWLGLNIPILVMDILIKESEGRDEGMFMTEHAPGTAEFMADLERALNRAARK